MAPCNGREGQGPATAHSTPAQFGAQGGQLTLQAGDEAGAVAVAQGAGVGLQQDMVGQGTPAAETFAYIEVEELAGCHLALAGALDGGGEVAVGHRRWGGDGHVDLDPGVAGQGLECGAGRRLGLQGIQ